MRLFELIAQMPLNCNVVFSKHAFTKGEGKPCEPYQVMHVHKDSGDSDPYDVPLFAVADDSSEEMTFEAKCVLALKEFLTK